MENKEQLAKIHVIILAGGRIKGFSPARNKGLIDLDGKPAVWYLLKTLSELGAKSVFIMFTKEDFREDSYDRKCFDDQIDRHFKIETSWDRLEARIHDKSGSSLNALCAGLTALDSCPDEFEHILILCGDVPLIQYSDMSNFLNQHKGENNDVTIMCVGRENPFNYGIIYNNGGTNRIRILESQEIENLLKVHGDYKKLTALIPTFLRDEADNQKVLNNAGPLLIRKDILTSERRHALADIDADNRNGYYTRILDILSDEKIGLYLIPQKEMSTAVGFDSYYEYIGTSARIKFLKDKYERS